MKKNVGPAAISVAAVLLIGGLVLMYRFFFPPLPPRDIDNPKGMPSYVKAAKEYMKNHKPGDPPPAGMPTMPNKAAAPGAKP